MLSGNLTSGAITPESQINSNLIGLDTHSLPHYSGSAIISQIIATFESNQYYCSASLARLYLDRILYYKGVIKALAITRQKSSYYYGTSSHI
jgi:hypothetical protein